MPTTSGSDGHFRVMGKPPRMRSEDGPEDGSDDGCEEGEEKVALFSSLQPEHHES